MSRDLDDYVQSYKNLGFEHIQEQYRFRRVSEVLNKLQLSQRFFNILEIGPGNNSVYRNFSEFENYIILEPISYFIESNTIDNSKVIVKNISVEEFLKSNSKLEFDLVILSSVLHEIEDPKSFLFNITELISSNSKIVVVVPNNTSLHRLIGEFEGFEKAGPFLTETERRMQQGVSFSVESLSEFVITAGLRVVEVFTSFIKPFPHFKMHDLRQSGVLSDSDLDSLYSLSNILQPYGSEIFAILEQNHD